MTAVLTIAGSDCSGGAGIQVGDSPFDAAITALVAENTVGVQDVHPSPPAFLKQQLGVDSLCSGDIKMDALKTGMLFDASITRAVVETLKAHYANESMPPLVCDPVCVATSGHSLLNPDAIQVMIEDLFPLATIITPNKSEVELLLSHGPLNPTLQSKPLKKCYCSSRNYALPRWPIRREHGDLQTGRTITQMVVVVDMLHQHGEENVALLIRPRIDSMSTHGTGCTLSAAIACGLATGHTLLDAVREATVYTHLGIETATAIGHGHGPLNHMHSISQSIIPSPTASNPYPFTRRLIQDNLKIWKAYVQHPFVIQLAQGVLPQESFLHFAKQDYHYLRYYARAYSLLAAKSTSFPAIASATQTILNVLHEIKNHTDTTPESTATMAYGGYLLDIGLQGDATKLMMALLACLLGYGEVGLWIRKVAAQGKDGFIVEGNPYVHWIEDYAGEMYQGAVRLGLETIEKCAMNDPPSALRYAEWCEVWQKCTRLEKGFWDMAMNLA
ncbi:Phosphomethylpyrimidine kinase-domain-containing protein [Mucidula mucida]|nr:Phosphomethylpyrimidine kinase-domain-containing protein [Mucidula mucida]